MLYYVSWVIFRVVIFTAAYYVCDGVSLTVRKLRAHLKSKGIDSRVVSAAPDGWSEEDVFTVRNDLILKYA
jgi:hypothetical protein